MRVIYLSSEAFEIDYGVVKDLLERIVCCDWILWAVIRSSCELVASFHFLECVTTGRH